MTRRVALITGAARGIGSAIATHLAGKGYDIGIHYHTSMDAARTTASTCESLGAGTALLQRQLTPESATALIGDTIEALGDCHLIINNASRFEYDSATTFSLEALDAHLAINFTTPVVLTMALHRHAQRNVGHDRHSVFVLDQKVANLNPDYLTYTLAKLSAASAVRALAQACAPLRVNAVLPGITLPTEGMTTADFDRARQVAALGRSNTPSDLAHFIHCLDSSPMVSGQSIAVDGGQHLIPLHRDVAFMPEGFVTCKK